MENIKKILKVSLFSLLVFILAACGEDSQEDLNNGSKDGEPSFAFVVLDQLGDKSFNDSAAEGMERIEKELGYETEIIEVGEEQSKWKPVILDITESKEYTSIILNGSKAQEIVEEIAGDYPDQKFVLFDANIEEDLYNNVYAISYKQNEGSYLGGVLAGMVTKSEMEYANDSLKIGFIGGDEDPIISDFLVGYIAGAQSVLEDVEVSVSYVGSWTDTAKAKELAFAQYQSGVDVIFPAAMTAGIGVIEAAVESDKYIIGVDSDQSMQFKGVDEKKANAILSSVSKEVGQSLYRYADLEGQNKVEYGTTEILGIEEKATDIYDNEYYQENVPEDIKDKVNEAREDVLEGNIEVPTSLGVPQSEVDMIIESAK